MLLEEGICCMSTLGQSTDSSLLPEWFQIQTASGGPSRYGFSADSTNNSTNTLLIGDLDQPIHSHSALGSLKVSPDAPCQVLFYEGKSGPCLVVTPKADSTLRLFILPGGDLHYGDTQLRLKGPALQGNPFKSPAQTRTATPQTLTSQAMILGAGLATRFEPVSGENTGYAKPSTPLSGSHSVIRCILETLKPHGFQHLFINTYFKADSLKKGLLDCQNHFQIHYLDESEPSGTAGALRKLVETSSSDCQQVFKAFQPTQAILIVQGDAVTDVDFSSLLQTHQQTGAALTIGCQVVRDEEVHQFGIIETNRSEADGVSGQITRFMEKPKLADAGESRLASTGFYVISPEVYPLVLQAYENRLASGKEGVLDFAQDVFPLVMAAQAEGKLKVYAQQVAGYWSDIGNPVQYLETLHDLFAQKVNLPLPTPPEHYFKQGVAFWPGAFEKIQALGIQPSGNVICAVPFSY
jgi:NDP-sugar pyrophosphorylase family protein